jgi:tetratricopeptide (TPR) repeat protein
LSTIKNKLIIVKMRIGLKNIVFFAVGIACVTFSCSKSYQAKKYNKQGWEHYKKFAFNLAIDDFTRAIEFNPQYAEAYSRRGYAYSKKSDFEHAIADLIKARDLDPKSTKQINIDIAQTYYKSGLEYTKAADYDKAIVDYIKALDFKPNDPGLMAFIGKTYELKNDTTKAKFWYDSALTNKGVLPDKGAWIIKHLNRLSNKEKSK